MILRKRPYTAPSIFFLQFVSELEKLKGSTAINEAKLKCGLCCKSYSVPLDRTTAGKVSFFKTSKYFRDNTT